MDTNLASLQNTTIEKFNVFRHFNIHDPQLFFRTLNWENTTQINVTTYNFFFTSYGLSQTLESSLSVLNTFNFFNDFNQTLNLDANPENLIRHNENDFSEEDRIFKNYTNLRKSTFIDFFISNLVDIPICFKKSKSLKTKNFEFFFLKFTNLLMRKGKKEKTFRLLWDSFFLFFNEKFEMKKFQILNKISWFDLFFFFNNTVKITNDGFWAHSTDLEEIRLIYGHSFSNDYKEFDHNFFIKNFLHSKLTQLSPLFSYFVYNVDKNVRKYTRGKSGKYIFVWKYIAPYKRHYLMYRWYLKELKFDESRTFGTRLYNLFNVLTYNLKQTYAWKAKNYTYAFIFKNFRKTLMTNLKTLAN